MSVQFSDECCTGQADDVLWVYAKVDAECYVPIGRLSSKSLIVTLYMFFILLSFT